MPLCNRVLPTGQIIAHPARGLLMGNRGILHDDNGLLGPARWKHRNWVCCSLSFKGRRRKLLQPRSWTELFFLDEAVALAAGHRPCAECRRDDYNRFRTAWERAFGASVPAPEMDRILHAARAVPGARRLRTWTTEADDLPDGTMVDDGAGPALVLAQRLHRFRISGYAPPHDRPKGKVVVLTPRPTVAVLTAGYRPLLHPTALTARFS